MNQQQLQIARAALWHQTAESGSAAIATLDDASAWLDAIGMCLFLPRHAQLPAPAPSFVEAVMGASSAAPPPAAIAQATEFATRLVAEGRAIPLNLLGTFTEQPDFLVTLDVLPWVVAIRSDRQWKTAPGGRVAPIVVRTWEALDRGGALTAVEIREQLGRGLTEAAVLRALVELWTTLRAVPAYTPGEPTRWSLLKSRCAPQLTTAANTGLPTALSALLSIYLRSAVAATAEEAEIFLSPLTARSRIRDVLHGMTAARQFGTMSVGSNTLLFVAGSLPETISAPEAEAASETAPGASAEEDRARRESIRKQTLEERKRPARPRPDRSGFDRPRSDRRGPARRDAGPPFRERPASRPWQRERADQSRPVPPRRDESGAGGDERAPRRDFRPAASAGGKPAPRPFQKREGGAKPWQKRPAPFRGREDRPGGRPPFARRDKPFQRPGMGSKSGPRAFDRSRPSSHDAGTRPPRRTAPAGPDAAAPKFVRPGPGMPRFDAAERAGRPAARRSGAGRSGPGKFGPGKFGAGKSGFSKPGFSKPGFGKPGFSKAGSGKPGFRKSGSPSGPGKFGPAKIASGPRKPGKFGAGKSGSGKPRSSFGAAQRGPGSFAKRTSAAPGAKGSFRPGGPARGAGRPRAGRAYAKPPRKNFSKPSTPRSPKPRKNRSEEKSSE